MPANGRRELIRRLKANNTFQPAMCTTLKNLKSGVWDGRACHCNV